MNCPVCNSLLPQGAAVCPQCGTQINSFGSTPTLPGSQPGQSPIAPNTNYGSDPYSAPPPPPSLGQSQSGGPGYYPNVSYPIPPPVQQPPRKKSKIGWIVSIISIVILLFCAGSVFGVTKLAQYGYQVEAQETATAQASNNITTPTLDTTNQITPTPVTTDSTSNPYPPKTGTLSLNDPLTDNTKGYKWDEATMKGKASANDISTCGFTDGAYHIKRATKGGLTCNPEATGLTFNNVAFEASLTIVQGEYAGLVVRVDQQQGSGYLFTIDTLGNYGLYNINFNASDAAAQEKTIFTGNNKAIKQGLNQANLLAIVVNDTSISVFVNGQFLQSDNDSTYTSGQIAVYGGSTTDGSDTIAANAKVWKL